MEFKSVVNTGATTSHNSPRRSIHEALLYIKKNICTLNGQELFFIFDTYLLNLLKSFVVLCYSFHVRLLCRELICLEVQLSGHHNIFI